MKSKFLSIAAAIVMLFSGGFLNSCTDYQDDYDAMNERLTALEDLVKMANKDISDIQTIVDAVEQGDYITSVEEVDNGYKITFKHYGEVVITNGKDGQDGTSPQLSVVKADPLGTGEETFYWALNGVLIQVDGQYVKAVGEDGKSAPTPRLEIRDGKWFYTFDDESNPNPEWVEMGPAVGKDGSDAQPLNMIFREVELTDYSAIFTLNQKDPVTNEYIKFEVPLYYEVFDELFTYNVDKTVGYENMAVMFCGERVLIDPTTFGFDYFDNVKISVVDVTEEFEITTNSESELIVMLRYPKDGKNDDVLNLEAVKTNDSGSTEKRQLKVMAGSPVLLVNQMFLPSHKELDMYALRGSLYVLRPQVSASREPGYLNCDELPKNYVNMEYSIKSGDFDYDSTTGREFFKESVEDSKLIKDKANTELKDGYLFIDVDGIVNIVSERSYLLKVTVSYTYASAEKEEFTFYVKLNRPM